MGSKAQQRFRKCITVKHSSNNKHKEWRWGMLLLMVFTGATTCDDISNHQTQRLGPHVHYPAQLQLTPTLIIRYVHMVCVRSSKCTFKHSWLHPYRYLFRCFHLGHLGSYRSRTGFLLKIHTFKWIIDWNKINSQG